MTEVRRVAMTSNLDGDPLRAIGPRRLPEVLRQEAVDLGCVAEVVLEHEAHEAGADV